MVNDQDFGERPENRRFYYRDNMEEYRLEFDTLEELHDYFERNGGK